MSDIIKTIKDMRRKLGLSQRELAARIGVTRSRIADYETNRSRIPAEEYLKIQELLPKHKGAGE